MKINEVVNEGFWKDLATGMRFKHTADMLGKEETVAAQQEHDRQEELRNQQKQAKILAAQQAEFVDTAKKTRMAKQLAAAEKIYGKKRILEPATAAMNRANAQKTIQLPGIKAAAPQPTNGAATKAYTAGGPAFKGGQKIDPTDPKNAKLIAQLKAKGIFVPGASEAKKNNKKIIESDSEELIFLQPGERLDISIPGGGKYYKTTEGWFNVLHQSISNRKSIGFLEKIADSSGRISKGMAPVKPLTALQKSRMTTLTTKATSPVISTEPPIFKSKGNEIMKNESKVINRPGKTFTGYNEWKQEIGSNTVGFSTFKEDNFGNEIARYKGKVIGKWDNENGEGIVYDLDEGVSTALAGVALAASLAGNATLHGHLGNIPDTIIDSNGESYQILSKKPVLKPTGKLEVNGKLYNIYFPDLVYPTDNKKTTINNKGTELSSIVKEDIERLINKYIVTEMAIRRLKKEKE
jgi:hypothetical protein